MSSSRLVDDGKRCIDGDGHVYAVVTGFLEPKGRAPTESEQREAAKRAPMLPPGIDPWQTRAIGRPGVSNAAIPNSGRRIHAAAP